MEIALFGLFGAALNTAEPYAARILDIIGDLSFS